MALNLQASFAGGELDPALHDRITLEKYDSGLKTARNVIVANSGRVVSRWGRKHLAQVKDGFAKQRLYFHKGTPYLVEFGYQYLRIYERKIDKKGIPYFSFVTDLTHTWSLDAISLEIVRFIPASKYKFYVVSRNRAMMLVDLLPGSPTITDTGLYNIPAAPYGVTINTNAATGYLVEYAVTRIVNGEESAVIGPLGGAGVKLPDDATKKNSIVVETHLGTGVDGETSIKVYRRPAQGGSFGLVGTSSFRYTSGGNSYFTFDDIGGAADYTQQPPVPVVSLPASPTVGVVFDQRLVLNVLPDILFDQEPIIASRIGKFNNFTRDIPLNDDSALVFKVGTGQSLVRDMVDSDGLIVFTDHGVYVNRSALSPDSIGFDRKGAWAIDKWVPALLIPGGVTFFDTKSNALRVLQYSNEYQSYTAPMLSIFSDHIFRTKHITSMAYMEGETPGLCVTLNDGTFATLTYEPDQQMRAWTRHDSQGLNVEQVADSDIPGLMFFLVEKNGIRYIEYTVPRFISYDDLVNNSEADIFSNVMFADSITMKYEDMTHPPLEGDPNYSLEPVTPGDWEGQLTLTSDIMAFIPEIYGVVGNVFRWFYPDLSFIDLEVVALVDNYTVTVQPSNKWPDDVVDHIPLYQTFNEVTGLGYLEGEEVSVIVDGGVVSSPNNDDDTELTNLTVTGGVLTLPDGMRGAVIHVGRPITADVETLDVATVEQRPTFLESKIVNKLYVRVMKTRGLYVSDNYPENNKVAGMVDADDIPIDLDGTILGNTYEKPQDRRIEILIDGDWKSQGRVCTRQVDPLHFEILSITPDLEDLRRRD